jgi:uncharacterized membrane protein
MRARPFLKLHAVQALALCAVLTAISLTLGVVTYGLGCLCATPLGLFVPLWPAYRVYSRGAYEMPVIAGFIRGRGWIDARTQTGEYL